MNTKQKAKIQLFLGSLAEKYRTNRDYFLSMDFSVFSGRNEYKGTLSPDGDSVTLGFSGKRTFPSWQEALDILTEEVLRYERAEIRYHERGKTTVILADDRNVRLEKRETEEEPIRNAPAKSEYRISPHKAAPLMRALGFLTEDGKLKNDMIRKYNQTNRFLELTDHLFDGLNNITVVDCACGKSYLSFVLNYYLWEEKRIKAKFVGIDISETVIEDSRKIAEALNYRNMTFIREDLRTYESDFAPDVVVSLHACDVATDMALGYALRHKVKRIMCVPCCHKELLEQYHNETIDALVGKGVFHARFNDLLTDALRVLKLEACGYQVSCVEYCSPLDTPKNLLITAVKVADSNAEKEREYRRMLAEFHVRPSVEYYSAISSDY